MHVLDGRIVPAVIDIIQLPDRQLRFRTVLSLDGSAPAVEFDGDCFVYGELRGMLKAAAQPVSGEELEQFLRTRLKPVSAAPLNNIRAAPRHRHDWSIGVTRYHAGNHR